MFRVQRGELPLYYGIGGRIKDEFDTKLAMRGVVGLDYLFARAPVDIFFEVAPMLDLTPSTDFEIGAGIGARFYFR